MIGLLEDLRPQFFMALKRQVDWTELTMISVQLTPREAVVVTNRHIYIFQQGIFRIRVNVIPIVEMQDIRIAGEDLVLTGQRGALGRLKFGQKKELRAPVYKRLRSFIR